MNISFKGSVGIKDAPIKSVQVIPSAMMEKSFDKTIKYLNAGDLFVLSNTEPNSSLCSGTYLVSECDKLNKGIHVIEIDSENGKVHSLGKAMHTAYSVEADCTVLGSLDIQA